jgi:integrase
VSSTPPLFSARFVAATATGMRRGELCGLQWGDIDLDAATLTVRRSLEETRAIGLRIKEPKSKAGRRTVALPPSAVALLRDYKIKRMEFRVSVGAGKLTDETPVFQDTKTGEGWLRPSRVSHGWRRFVVAKGLPQVTFHALRHTHVSLLLNKGVDILTISRRIGHSKASITLDVYAHLMGGADQEAALVIEGVLK